MTSAFRKIFALLFLLCLHISIYAQIRNIEFLARLPHLFLIKSGLKNGDKIIFEGIQNVKNEILIKPEMVEMRKIIHDLSAK